MIGYYSDTRLCWWSEPLIMIIIHHLGKFCIINQILFILPKNYTERKWHFLSYIQI